MNIDSPKLSLEFFDTYSISLPQYQPRTEFDHAELVELAQSLKSSGLIQPLCVYIEDGKRILIAGERRWRAAQLAELKQVPCIVTNRKLSDKERFVMAMSENLHRVDLGLWDMATSLQRYQQQFSLSLQDIVNLHGGTVTKWSRYLKINKAFNSLQCAIKDKNIKSVVIIGALIDIHDVDSEFAEEVLHNLLYGQYDGTAERYVKDCKARINAKDSLGYLPPQPDGVGRYDESHPNVLMTDWYFQQQRVLSIRVLQVAMNKWVGGFTISLGKTKMDQPISESFSDKSQRGLVANLANHLKGYVEGLSLRTQDPVIKASITALKPYLDTLIEDSAVLKPQGKQRTVHRERVSIVPERMSRDADKLIITIDNKEVSIDIKAIRALL